jgi:hypothetical protein
LTARVLVGFYFREFLDLVIRIREKPTEKWQFNDLYPFANSLEAKCNSFPINLKTPVGIDLPSRISRTPF